MAGKRKLDNIERDVIAAMELGYGVHYGWYKADHPHTQEEASEPNERSQGIQKDAIACLHCGKVFSPVQEGRSHNSKYCCFECYRAANTERAKNRRTSVR